MQDNQRQTHWAYIAGIMDADGCFMIEKWIRKTKNKITNRALVFPKRKGNWSIAYSPSLKVAMVEPEAVEFLEKEINIGHVNHCGARRDRPNSKRILQWNERNKHEIVPFLENVLPFLKVKKIRAQHLLEYCYHVISVKNPCYRGLSEEELNYREEMYLKMRQLNGSKVAATTKS